jgi:hypothetical protein
MYGKAGEGNPPGPETNEKTLGPIYPSSPVRQVPKVTRSPGRSRPSSSHPWRNSPNIPSRLRPSPVTSPMVDHLDAIVDPSRFADLFNSLS